MDVKIEKGWKQKLESQFELPYFQNLVQFVKEAYNTKSVFPKGNEIFRAFDECPFDNVKVVILGQDPYPTRGHAHGLCFSVEPDVKPLPKSLNNIYKEMHSDLGIEPRSTGDLTHWAQQGILLLNSVLTVEEGAAASHSGKGWEQFTDQVINQLNAEKDGLVYILWGSKAQQKAQNVDSANNLILKSPHPSPLSAHRGFFGSQPFSKTNAYLRKNGKAEIEW